MHRELHNSERTIVPWTFMLDLILLNQLRPVKCGVFIMKYACFLSRCAPFTFSAGDMELYRRRAIFEILTQQALYP